MPELEVATEPTGAEKPDLQAAPAADTAKPASERPSWLPEGFDSPEALASAYQELKGKAPEDTPADQPPAGSDEAVAKFVKDVGLDPVALSKEIVDTGNISAQAKEALAKKLEAVGLPASLIDDYVTGQKAVYDSGVSDIMSAAGGQQGYDEMIAWANETLSDADRQAYINIMQKADAATAKLTVGNLYARYQAEADIPGKRLRGTAGSNTGDVFRSWEQQLEAQKDPRYAKDPAYRNDVERKIERTIKAGGYKRMAR